MPLASRWSLRRLVAAALVVAAVVAVGAVRPFRSAAVVAVFPSLGLDLTRPDALIDTASLAALPRDLLRVPLFKDVLTEDVVFYYEQSEGRLSLAGTLRRLAYEHDLEVADRVLGSVLDEPAEVALWKGADGRLAHALVVITRTHVVRLVEAAARAALSDTYLRRLAIEVPVEGDSVPLFALTYGSGRTLVFAGRGDRLVVASHAGMLTDESGALSDRARHVLAAVLSRDSTSHRIYHDRFEIEPRRARHSVAVSARYASFGYQRFFPAVQALRFDFGRDGWSTRVLLDTAALAANGSGTSGVWAMAPTAPSVCVALPVDWRAAAALVPAMGASEADARVASEAAEGPAGVCWYRTSRLHTPLFVVPVRRALDARGTTLLGRMFASVVGTREPTLAGQDDPRFPVVGATRPAGSFVWQRQVAARSGVHRDAGSTRGGHFLVTLAQHPRGLVFSPDNGLVEDALAVADKRWPALADSLPASGTVLAVVTPRSLAALLEAETFATLTPAEQPVFRNAATAHLLPKLEALARYPAYALVVPPGVSSSDAWLPVDWVTVGAGTP
jgi:uncharacterized protein YfaA (DUF2138 family)